MKIRKDSPGFGDKKNSDVELTSEREHPIWNVQLEEGESIQLLVPMSDNQTCVHLDVVCGYLEIDGGGSIISSNKSGDRTQDYNCSPESPLEDRSIEEISGANEKVILALRTEGIETAGDLADCTYDGVEASYGSNFATMANDWLKTLGLSMRYQ